MAKVDWDTTKHAVAEPRNFDPVPKGRYLCVIDDTEMKQTKDKKGSYLEVTHQIISPKEYKGRKVWARLNVNNPSEIAQRIGREQFNALCMATVKTLEVDKTERLHAKRVIVHVGIDKSGDEPQNKVTGWEPYVAQGGPSEQGQGGPSETKPAPPPQETKPAAPPRQQADFEDDIPF
jgi:hypothetical protein